MTNLTRVTGKVFGGEAPLDEIGQFGSAKAGTKLNTQDVATIQALPAYANGWGSAIMTSRNFPPIEEVTGVLKTISYQNCYLLQEGVPTYDINTNYSSTSVVKVVNGATLDFYVSLANDNQGNSLSDADWWAKASFANKSLGEIITSVIPLTDSAFHLLDGALIEGSGIYADFVTYISNIYNSSLNYFCTEAEWQESVNTYGVCGKFVYDSVNNTVRLPKITGFIEGASGVSNLGDLTQAGLPNITANTVMNTNQGIYYSTSGAFGKNNDAGTFNCGTVGGGYGRTLTFDASRSSSIYGNSDTVQPQSVKVLYYIVVATATKTDIEVDIDQIATDLNGKLDTDGTNATTGLFENAVSVAQSTGKVTTVGWAMPNLSGGISIGSNTTYTAPSCGWLFARIAGDWTQYFGNITVNGVLVTAFYGYEQGRGTDNVWIPISKSDVIVTQKVSAAVFYPAKGV